MAIETQLRMASSADLAQLRSWFSSLAALRLWGGPEMGWARNETDWLFNLQWPDTQSFALWRHQCLVGFGQLRFTLDDDGCGYCHLARLVIHPEARGCGLGRQLLVRLMTLGRSLWRPDCYSLYVFEHNQPALSLYVGHGFQQVGHYGDSLSVLRLEKRVVTTDGHSC